MRQFKVFSGVVRQCVQARIGSAATVLLLLLALPVSAQWTTQTIKLVPGFNPVYLQVTPPNTDCSSVFGSVPGIQHVWMYNRYLQTSTFTTNPQDATHSQDHWLMWFPATGAKGFLSTLSQVRGGQCYLVNLATNAAPVTITITGVPASPRIDWIPNDLVLAGFPIAEAGKVTFFQFLKDTPEVSTTAGSGSGIYSINPLSARETQVRNPELTAITPGKAYWVRLGVFSDNPYPVQVTAPGENNSLQFVQDQNTATLTLVNSIDTAATAPQVIQLKLIDSGAAPVGKPAKAGRAVVAALVPAADGSLSPKLLSDGLDLTLRSGEKRSLQIGLATALLATTTSTDATYQAFIEVTEAKHGFRQLIPVVAEVPGSKLFARRGSLLGKEAGPKVASSSGVTTTSPSAGLWLGNLTLNAVNQPGFSQTNTPSTSDYPLSPATPLKVRALIHVTADGVPRLVQQVYFADVSDGTNRVVWMYNTPATFPAGAIPKARISAPSWPGLAPTTMTGSFGSNLFATVSVPYDDRLNPFVHHYHPDHNNLAEDFVTKLPAGQESFNITRSVGFYFGATIATGLASYGPAVPVMNFTGTAGEYVKADNVTNTTTLSAQFWVNIPTNQQNGANLLLLTNTTTKTDFQIAFQNNTGNLVLNLKNKAGTNGQLIATTPLPTGRWCNVTVTYDGTYGDVYVDGQEVAFGTLPLLESGVWTSAWVGNTATNGTPSFIGEIHDVVVRNGATTVSTVTDKMVVPDIADATGIVLRLQGSPTTLNVVNLGSSISPLSSSGSALIDASAAPAVPLWTYGTAQGSYRETITGLRRQAITLGGTFQFTRINQDPNLR